MQCVLERSQNVEITKGKVLGNAKQRIRNEKKRGIKQRADKSSNDELV